MRKAQFPHFSGTFSGRRDSSYEKVSLLHRSHSRQSFCQLALSVSLDSCNAQYLARSDFQADAVYGHQSPVICHIQIIGFYKHVSRASRLFYIVKQDFSAYHHGGQHFLVYILGFFYSHQLAAPHYSYSVGDGHDFV